MMSLNFPLWLVIIFIAIALYLGKLPAFKTSSFKLTLLLLLVIELVVLQKDIYLGIALASIILPFLTGGYILIRIRILPKKCDDKKCDDIRCDIAIVKLYSRVCFTLILVGSILAILYGIVLSYKLYIN